MVSVKQLIEENNVKREELSSENEKYYTSMLLYIRTQLHLSERQSEELLMEILDHLLEAQKEGKSAEDVFGSNPKAYADELISLLPNEKSKEKLTFLAEIFALLFGWFMVISGAIDGIIGQFKDVSDTIYLYSTSAVLLTMVIGVFVETWLIFKLIRITAFSNGKHEKKLMILAGISGACFFGAVMAISYFYKGKGPEIYFPWYTSLGIGSFFLLVNYLMSMQRKNR